MWIIKRLWHFDTPTKKFFSFKDIKSSSVKFIPPFNAFLKICEVASLPSETSNFFSTILCMSGDSLLRRIWLQSCLRFAALRVVLEQSATGSAGFSSGWFPWLATWQYLEGEARHQHSAKFCCKTYIVCLYIVVHGMYTYLYMAHT